VKKRAGGGGEGALELKRKGRCHELMEWGTAGQTTVTEFQKKTRGKEVGVGRGRRGQHNGGGKAFSGKTCGNERLVARPAGPNATKKGFVGPLSLQVTRRD